MILTRKTNHPLTKALAAVGITSIVLVMSACSSSGGSASSTGSSDPIKIGVDLSLTGPIAFAGVQELAGMKLAEQAINDSGGILGRPLQLVTTDDTSTPDQSILNIRKLAQQDQVVAIAGPGSSNSTVAGAQAASDLNIPLLALPSTTGDIWEGPNRAEWGFGIAGDGAALGYGCMASVVTAEKAKGHDIKSIAIGLETNPGPQSYVSGVEAYAKDNNIQVLDNLQWAGDVTDLTTQVNQLLATGADAVEVSALQNSDVLAVKAMDQLGALGKTPLANCSATDLPALYKALGTTAEKPSFYTQVLLADAYPSVKTGAPNDAEREKVYEAFQKYGKAVAGVDSLSNFSYAGWDTIQVLKLAIEKANSTDGAAVRDALEQTNYIGAQNTMVFGPQQHRATYDDYAAIAAAVVFGPGGTLALPTK
jgi:branched-chain amino acid transport system substrate-binding protein